MSDLKITAKPDENHKDIILVQPDGFLDGHTAPEFKRVINGFVDKGAVKIVVDGQDLNYISSAGLGVFMSVIDPARKKGGDIVISNLTESIYSIFETLGFTHLFKIYKDNNEALAHFKG